MGIRVTSGTPFLSSKIRGQILPDQSSTDILTNPSSPVILRLAIQRSGNTGKASSLSSRFSFKSLEISFQFLPLLPPLNVSLVREEILSRKSVIESAEQIHDTFFVYDLGEYSLATTILMRQKRKRKIEISKKRSKLGQLRRAKLTKQILRRQLTRQVRARSTTKRSTYRSIQWIQMLLNSWQLWALC